jgi:hypothetical protein
VYLCLWNVVRGLEGNSVPLYLMNVTAKIKSYGYGDVL